MLSLPTLACCLVFQTLHASEHQAEDTSLSPGAAVDFGPLAFYPDRWKKQKVKLSMVPWSGNEVVFLTTTPEFDHKVMAGLVSKLDQGWQHYHNLTGGKPSLHKHLDGKPTMAAVPGFSLTCGYGCGMVGATGIELGAFYSRDYQSISRDPSAVPDYYFYEMGRNYYTFEDRHSLYITGFAVFMRYVCIDKLELIADEKLRKTIEDAEQIYAKTDMSFLRAFTTVGGLSEKENRLNGANGSMIYPSDQPVMYASAMLRLRRDYGGDKWVERFFKHLRQCPPVRIDPKSPSASEAAIKQSMNWLVAASAAAGEDLSPVFVDEWRFPLNKVQRQLMRSTDWKDSTLDVSKVITDLSR